MNLLFVVILGGWRLIAELVFILLVLLFYALQARKIVVTVPSITLDLSPTSGVKHGDTVDATGIDYADGTTPAAGETIVLTLTDSKGSVFPGATVQTDQDGKYAAAIVVPGVAAGAVSVEASDELLGVTATKTFTLAQHPKNRKR